MLERLGIEAPVVQAPMGGGLSRAALAAAVSEAGGLGMIAVNGADAIRREVAEARRLTGRPIGVGLLLNFARESWFAAAAEADVLWTFWGAPERHGPGPWIHQCGSAVEALAAHRAGADAVAVQGVEAGGHVRGTVPGLELLARVRAALPPGYPLLLAGGVAERDDVARALDAGAVAAVAGTRFLAAEESRAHPEYRRRLVTDGGDTVLTDLFGFGWPGPHRVLPNAATRRYLEADGRVPATRRTLNRLSGAGARHLPEAVPELLARAQRPASPLLTPVPPTDDRGEHLLEAGPLYAGESVVRIRDVRPAAQLVADLTP